MIPAAFAITGATQQGHDVAQVPLGVTLLFMALLMAMILCLALEEKLHAKKSVIVGLFAVVTLFLGAAFDLLPFGSVSVGGHEIDLPVYVPAIDWNVIAIILGSSLFVDVTSPLGPIHLDRDQTDPSLRRRSTEVTCLLRSDDSGVFRCP